ncbi:flippase-like domain-containing protein [Candidatus Nanohaloarchaea archaeon]|nr:flippase-like domain-containing protein [Candidatus Nanohaloarchaea archaeon]
MATKKQIAWFGVSTAIIAALIFFADASKFIDAVQQANGYYLIAALVLGIAPFFIFTYTWHSFLNKMGADTSYLETYKLFMAGNFMNSVTPLGQFGGEPFMAYVIKKNTDLTYEEGFSAVLSSDIINAVPIFTFIFGGAAFLLLFGSLNDIILQTLYASVIIILIGGTLAYLLWFKSGTLEKKIIKGLRRITDTVGRGKVRVDSIEKKMVNVQKAFNRIGEEPRHLLKTAIIAHTYFIIQVFCLYLILASLGYYPDFTPLYFILPLASLSNFSPTPGGSGAYEAALATIITVMPAAIFPQIPFATALVAGILFRLCTYWPGLIIGYGALVSIGGAE